MVFSTIEQDRKRQAQEAINAFLLASGGDSNDAEIAAGRDCMELLADFAGVEVKVIPDKVDKDLAAQAAENIATMLGSAEDWGPSLEFLERIAELLFDAGFRHPNNDENRTYYESISE